MYWESHVHTSFSFLDGVSNPKVLARRAKQLGYPALPITDHGNIAGWFEHMTACEDEGIKPVFGCELYVAEHDKDYVDPNAKRLRLKTGHLIVYAKNQTGINNLIQLCNNTWNHYSERGSKCVVLENELFEKHEGLICTSACIGSYITTEERAKRFHDVFKDDFYIELQPHIFDTEFVEGEFVFVGDKQIVHNRKMMKFAHDLNIEIITAGDSHYAEKGDNIIQDIIILNIPSNKNGWKIDSTTLYLMDTEEHWNAFVKQGLTEFTRADFEKSMEVKDRMLSKIEDINLRRPPSLRPFDVTSHPLYKEGMTNLQLVGAIIKDKGKLDYTNKRYMDRLRREMEVIVSKGFVDYFLFQEDIIRWCNNNGVLVGPARGSAGGCLLAYLLDITKIDPLEYDLLFERFLDESRSDFPDIDIDYSDRDRVIEYCKDKYGRDKVLSVGTYHKNKIKSTIKDCCRVLYPDVDFALINEITSKIKEDPEVPDILQDFKQIIERSREEYTNTAKDQTSLVQNNNLYFFLSQRVDLYKACVKVLGKVKGVQMHASAVVISEKPINEYLPIFHTKAGDSTDNEVTAYDGAAIQASGLIKFDILGVINLRYIADCLELIKASGRPVPEIYKLVPDDKEVWKRIADGDTDTVFQMNTYIIKNILKKMKCDCFNDAVACLALVRPGPALAGFDKLYIDRKFGKINKYQMYDEEGNVIPVKYKHPIIDEVLAKTYNVFVYQEQVMKLFRFLGGFSLADTNIIRKALSKKKTAVLNKYKVKFKQYAMSDKIGWTEQEVDDFYNDVVGFGSYGFNESHSVGYAYLAYVCEYLKVHYPTEWYLGVLKNCKEEVMVKTIATIEKENIVGLQDIDVNNSESNFCLKDGKIVLPYKFLKGVGVNAINSIVDNRPYTSLKDFVSRVDGRRVTMKTVMALIVNNAFRTIEPDKTREDLIREYFAIRKKEVPENLVYICEDKSAMENYRIESNALYCIDYVDKFPDMFSRSTISVAEALTDYADRAKIIIGGRVNKIEHKVAKTGNSYMRMLVKNGYDEIWVTVWNKTMNKIPELEKSVGHVVQIGGDLNVFNGRKGMILNTFKIVEI